MKTNYTKLFLTLFNAALLLAATLLVTPSPQPAFAFEKAVGQDKTGKNCERVDTPGSSTFGKCESVCKDKEITRDAPNNRWVCKASKTAGAQTGATRAPLGDKVLEPAKPSTKPPRASQGSTVGKTKKQ